MTEFKRMRMQMVELLYPRLDQLYRYDPTFKRDDGGRGKSVAATANEQGANWSVGINLDEKRGKLLYKKCEDHFKACKPDEKFGGVWGYKEINGDELRLVFTAKRNAKNAKGKENEAPGMDVDEAGNALPDRAIKSGSKGDVYFAMYPAFNPSADGGKGAEGISLYLSNLVVWDPQYGSNDFEDVDETPAASSAPKSSNQYDDEIPF